jgi:hypothetical protein
MLRPGRPGGRAVVRSAISARACQCCASAKRADFPFRSVTLYAAARQARAWFRYLLELPIICRGVRGELTGGGIRSTPVPSVVSAPMPSHPLARLQSMAVRSTLGPG